ESLKFKDLAYKNLDNYDIIYLMRTTDYVDIISEDHEKRSKNRIYQSYYDRNLEMFLNEYKNFNTKIGEYNRVIIRTNYYEIDQNISFLRNYIKFSTVTQ